MIRLSGIDLPDNKRIDYALTRLYGIGWTNVVKVLEAAKIEASKRTQTLNEDEVNKIQKILDQMMVEGDLRREVAQNIQRLKESGSFRGLRHSRNLPSRGQRTRSNARTKRGKRVTIGAIKKEMAAKTAGAAPATDKGKK